MERLDRSLRSEVDRLDPAKGGMSALTRAWPAAVGAENARRSWPARLNRDGTLVVHAADSVWAFQLGMLAGEVLERLRAELGEAAPRALKFVQGRVPTPARKTASPPPEIAPADTAAGAELAAPIENEELRSAVARAAAASLANARREAAAGRRF